MVHKVLVNVIGNVGVFLGSVNHDICYPPSIKSDKYSASHV